MSVEPIGQILVRVEKNLQDAVLSMQAVLPDVTELYSRMATPGDSTPQYGVEQMIAGMGALLTWIEQLRRGLEP